MRTVVYILGFIFPLMLFSQEEKVFVISDSTLANSWSTLGENWRYQKGDNKAWAAPDFDDSSWNEFSYFNLNMPDGENAIANRGEIAWFRKRIKADSSLTKTLVINIYQLGASEIYLDGKLIHQLGTIDSNPDKVVFNNPYQEILQFSLENGKEQVLAVRYVNAQYKFPIYTNTNGFIRIEASTLSNASSKDVLENNRIVFQRKFEKNYYITLGVAILLFIIFLSVYLFFPNEKINGYFTVSNLFLLLFIGGVIWSINNSGIEFWIVFFYDTCILISGLIVLFCLYKILEQPIDLVFKAICLLCIIAIACFFLYDPDIVAPAFALFVFIATIRIAIKSWNKKRVASVLFLSSNFVSLVFWALIVLYDVGLVRWSVSEFIPFTFMLGPIMLAIYLGYAFGRRSQELRLNLERIQKLSKEKESILFKQKENLEHQVSERTASLNTTLQDLKATQSQLIQSEKMASLGELTAGIAHEIQNPLNFVNNFSEVSNELLEEMNEELNKGDIDEAKAISTDIKLNLEKITHHGKRADAIVKGMLQHSRKGSAEKEPTDLNKLADEYLRLAYHGLRAKDKSFNAILETDFDTNLGLVNVMPQDMGRVVLNLITNAFYAVNEKKSAEVHAERSQSTKAEKEYTPTVSVRTKKEGEAVLIIVKDNGNGIPEHVVDKIFQPFFTTKPTGQGTGLGLSMSYDIVTQGHGGELKVEAQEGVGTSFIVQIPIKN